MIEVAQGMWNSLEEEAKKMLAAGETLAPLTTPNGHAMMHVTTDESKLRLTLMEAEVDGTKVFAGMIA